MAAQARAWISPKGEVHNLASMELHPAWARKNLDKVDKKHHAVVPYEDGRTDGPGTSVNMINGGWVRKTATDGYHVGKHSTSSALSRTRESTTPIS